jgi:hypothetical protein
MSGATQLVGNRFRFVPMSGKAGVLNERVVEVRKLLRTNLSFKEIAGQLGVTENALRRFIRQRNLCDLKARREFISRFKLVHGVSNDQTT